MSSTSTHTSSLLPMSVSHSLTNSLLLLLELMLQGMAALRLLNGLEDKAFVSTQVKEIIERSLTPGERARLEAVYPSELQSEKALERWRELSKEASGEAHLVYPAQSMNKIIEVNCKDIEKYRRDCRMLVGFLKDEMSDVSVRVSMLPSLFLSKLVDHIEK